MSMKGWEVFTSWPGLLEEESDRTLRVRQPVTASVHNERRRDRV
jgi:hypothetical protein